ncbi:hypothetical protein ACIGO9_26730 [Nocardia asteroides]|uniref:hypothetical protein n=1 Tax=Nocardia asteroides TaxID=1824 RepID=UPI0037C63DDF
MPAQTAAQRYLQRRIDAYALVARIGIDALFAYRQLPDTDTRLWADLVDIGTHGLADIRGETQPAWYEQLRTDITAAIDRATRAQR